MIEIHDEDTTFNTGKFPNSYLASISTRLCWHSKWKKRVVWAQCVKTMAKGLKLHGHEGKRRGRHCTSTGRGAAAQSEGSALHKFCHIHNAKGLLRLGVARATAHSGARGNTHRTATVTPCNACLDNFQSLQRPPLVIFSTLLHTK